MLPLYNLKYLLFNVHKLILSSKYLVELKQSIFSRIKTKSNKNMSILQSLYFYFVFLKDRQLRVCLKI